MTIKTTVFLLGLAVSVWSARTAAGAEIFHGRGVVTAIKNQGQVLVINHEAIPGLMEAMTMPFELSDPGLAKGIKVGDEIRFTLVHKAGFWPIVALKKIKAPKKTTPAAGTVKATVLPTATMAPMNMPM